MAEHTIETLEVVIERNSTQAVEKLDQLLGKLQQLKYTATIKTSSALNKIANGIESIAKSINSVDIAKIEKFASILETFSALKGLTKKTASAVEGVFNAVNGPPTGTSESENTKENLKGELSAREKLKKTYKELTKIGDKAMKPFNKLFKSMARIAMYRAIRSFFSTLTKSIKEGVQNLYQYDKLMGGSFADALDRVSTSINYIKNSLGAAVSTVLVALTPVIEKAADVIAEFSNGVAVLVARAQGLSTVTIAAKGMKEFAENSKKAKASLMGFDELNQIGNNGNIADMFETIDISQNGELVNNFKNTVNKITAIVAGSLIALGAILLLFGQLPQGIALIVAGLGTFGGLFVANYGETIVNWIVKTWATIENFFNSTVKPFFDITVPTFFVGIYNSVKDAFIKAWEVVKEFFAVTVKGFFDTTIPMYFKETWKTIKNFFNGTVKTWLDDNIVSIFVNTWGKVKEFFTVTVKDWFTKDVPNFFKNVGINIANAIINGLNKLGNFTIPGLKLGEWEIWGDTTIHLFNIPTIPAYSTGGFPEDGLFFANSNELVGQFGNGRTAVANNDQIIEGISRGVYDAVVAANSQRENQNINLKLYLDGKQIKTAYDRAAYNMGARIATGGVVVS